jgi:hypothetical protein
LVDIFAYQLRIKIGLGNYQVKGIGAMVSYELLPDTDIEIKHASLGWETAIQSDAVFIGSDLQVQS